MLLEPLDEIEVSTPDRFLGDVLGDLSSRRGHILGTDSLPGGHSRVRAVVPQAELHLYATDLFSKTHGHGNFVVRLDVRCSNDSDAAISAGALTKTTNLLRSLIAHEGKQPNPADLSGFFASGTFRSEGPRVFGYWTIQRSLIDTLLGGG